MVVTGVIVIGRKDAERLIVGRLCLMTITPGRKDTLMVLAHGYVWHQNTSLTTAIPAVRTKATIMAAIATGDCII